MEKPPAGYTGFTISVTAAPDESGRPRMEHPIINEVLPDTPAAAAGLERGDVILSVNGEDARQVGALYPIVGEPYRMRVRRGDRERDVELRPVAKPLRYS